MRGLKGFSIRQKIISIILAVTIISIVTGLTIEIFSNIKALRKELAANISHDAKLSAEYLVPTYLFDDIAGAKEILRKLENIPDIIYGAAYLPSGTIYAEYKSPTLVDSVNSIPKLLKIAENKNRILIREQVKSKDEILGTVFLIASTHVIQEKTKSHIKSVLIILFISVLLAILLAFW